MAAKIQLKKKIQLKNKPGNDEEQMPALDMGSNIKVKINPKAIRQVNKKKDLIKDALSALLESDSEDDEDIMEGIKHMQDQMRSKVDAAPRKKKTSVVLLDALNSVTESMEYGRISRAHGQAFKGCVKQLLQGSKAVEVCFLVDITLSMDPHINAVKDYIRMVVEHFKHRYKNFEARLSFVGYRDWSDGEDQQFEVLDFTESLDEFVQFVDNIEAYGGGDIHENVLGGLDLAVSKVSWTRMSKLIIHILDAPPHGIMFGSYGDDDPQMVKYDYRDVQDLFFEMGNWSGNGMAANTPINYIMVDTRETYLEETKKIFRNWYEAVSKQLRIGASGWWFDIVEMNDPTNLINLMFKSITSAMHASVSRSVSSQIHRNKQSDDNYSIDATPSDEIEWDNLPETKVNLHVYESPNVTQPDTFLPKGCFIMPKPAFCYVKMAENPFDEGSERICFHGKQWYQPDTPPAERTKVVIKLQKDHSILGGIAMGCKKHAIVKGFIDCFNTELRSQGITNFKLKIVSALHIKNEEKEYSMEPYIPGQFLRINNNLGIVMMQDELQEWIHLGQCFSFFTYIVSEEKVLVADVQGWLQKIKNKHTLLLTDPAIHNSMCPGAYGVTDLGRDGIREFLKSYDWKNNR